MLKNLINNVVRYSVIVISFRKFFNKYIVYRNFNDVEYLLNMYRFYLVSIGLLELIEYFLFCELWLIFDNFEEVFINIV